MHVKLKSHAECDGVQGTARIYPFTLLLNKFSRMNLLTYDTGSNRRTEKSA
jgi:hypothetical protein